MFVSPTGSDSAAGTEAAPLHTLGAAVAKAAGGGAVVVRAGKFFLNSTLELTAAHSGISIAAYQGEHVTVSGGAALALAWSKYQGEIMKAQVSLPSVLSDAERSHWAQRAKSAPPTFGGNATADHKWGPPPARWNTMFVNGVRQVRARFPNGNPQDSSGICFSSTNR